MTPTAVSTPSAPAHGLGRVPVPSCGIPRSIVVALALALLAAWHLGPGAAPAAADHYEYSVVDPAKQNDHNPPSPRLRNHAQAWWVIGQPVYASFASSIAPDAVAAVNNWINRVPQLRWVANEQFPDYRFLEETDLAKCGARPACHRVTQWYEMPIEDAMYILKGEVVIIQSPLNWQFTPTGRIGAIAHETGHAYGLHERYIDSDGTNRCSAEVTIMDNIKDISSAPTGPDLYAHCDDNLQGPTQTDGARIGSSYSGRPHRDRWGELVDWTLSRSGTSVTCTWRDLGLAETYHEVVFFYWNGSLWQELARRNHYDKIGVNRILNDRAIQETFNRTDYGTPAGNYAMNFYTYYASFQEHGPWTGCGSFFLD